MDTLLQKEIGELREFYVEMHPMHGHDSHNPPLLYHSDIEKVDELFDDINKALLRFTKSVIEEAMPEEKKSYYGCITHRGLSGMDCDVCRKSVDENNKQIGFNACRAQLKENTEKILKDNEKEV